MTLLIALTMAVIWLLVIRWGIKKSMRLDDVAHTKVTGCGESIERDSDFLRSLR